MLICVNNVKVYLQPSVQRQDNLQLIRSLVSIVVLCHEESSPTLNASIRNTPRVLFLCPDASNKTQLISACRHDHISLQNAR